MKVVCDKNKCSSCAACANVCPKQAITLNRELNACVAVIDESKCVDCRLCYNICHQHNVPHLIKTTEWYQGWITDSDKREAAASGGIATAIMEKFICDGGVVASCVFVNGDFRYIIADKIDQLVEMAGSKYVKSNPDGIYAAVKEYLTVGKPVLFVGLPCQVAAAKNFVGIKLSENLFTVDIICHGSPSPQVLDIFLKQYNMSLKNIDLISFRTKGKYQIDTLLQGVIDKGVTDKYSIAFLGGITYTDNCYSCTYARQERVSDLTLGDSWGTQLSVEEQRRGISLILVQTSKGKELLENAEVHLEPVDSNIAIDNNQQLREPSHKPNKYDWFFEKLKSGSKFNKLVFECFPKQCVKQNLKKLLIRTGVRSPKGKINFGIMVHRK